MSGCYQQNILSWLDALLEAEMRPMVELFRTTVYQRNHVIDALLYAERYTASRVALVAGGRLGRLGRLSDNDAATE